MMEAAKDCTGSGEWNGAGVPDQNDLLSVFVNNNTGCFIEHVFLEFFREKRDDYLISHLSHLL
jgi:hypothetical protein